MESRQTGRGGEPIIALAGLDYVCDQPAGQAVPGGEIGEPVAVEKRYPLDRAKPEIPLGVPVDLRHPIPNQTVLGGKDPERWLLRT